MIHLIISDHFSTRGKNGEDKVSDWLDNYTIISGKLTFFQSQSQKFNSSDLFPYFSFHDSYENFEVHQANFSFDEFLWFHHPSSQ